MFLFSVRPWGATCHSSQPVSSMKWLQDFFRRCRKLCDKCPLIISPEACRWASRLLIQSHDGGKAETRQAGCRAAAIVRLTTMIGAASHAWIVAARCPGQARLAGSADWCCGALPLSCPSKSGVRGIIHADIWTHELTGIKIGARLMISSQCLMSSFSG